MTKVIPAFLVTILSMIGIILAIPGVLTMLKVRSEETSDRVEPVLAGAVSRSRYYASNVVLALPQFDPTGVTLSLPCQLGVRVADSVECTTNLFPAAPWVPLAAFTNDPVPDAAGFETGWTTAETNLDLSGTGDSPALYFRVKRRWLAP